jgi:parallel beta-helix repeat protein
MDCGEGIHVLGANHVIVSNNFVERNSGGILISDDIGATHDNLISDNTVQDNPYACGLTMASHPAAAFALFYGVGSLSQHDLCEPIGKERTGKRWRAGAGLFSPVPSGKTYGNVVVNNLIHDNGLPGIAMNAHIPGQNLNDNVLVGNTIVNNGPDSEDAATPGPTGINMFAAGAVTGTIVSGNFIQGEEVSVVTNTTARSQVHLNSLLGLESVWTIWGKASVNATQNWWGCESGPRRQGCPV